MSKRELRKLEKRLWDGMGYCPACQRQLALDDYLSYRRLLVELNKGEPGGIFEIYSKHVVDQRFGETGKRPKLEPIVPNAVRGMPFNLVPVRA